MVALLLVSYMYQSTKKDSGYALLFTTILMTPRAKISQLGPRVKRDNKMLYFSLKRIRNIFLRIFFLHNKVCLCNGTANCHLNCFSKEMLYYIDFKCASITFLNKQRKQPGKYQCLCVHEIRLLHIFEISSMYFK